MVAGDTVCVAEGNHVSHNSNGIENARSSIDKIPDEDGLSSKRMMIHKRMKKCPWRYRDHFVTQLPQERFQFIAAAVNVADDVKRAVLLPFVVPQGHALDRGGINFFRAFQHKHLTEPFASKPPERAAKLSRLL